MSEVNVVGGEPDLDELARIRIATDLDTNLLVEAGAGSGKTTSLIQRMLALIDRGTPVERIAAVTFTRKAANELRERFQMQLEKRNAESEPGSVHRGRFETALSDLERSFIGTIHSFCGRLLRERPLEVGLDPNFTELTDEEWADVRNDFWSRWVERLHTDEDPCLRNLADIGIDSRQLYSPFKAMIDYPDVDFSIVELPAPDFTACRNKIDVLLARANSLMPRHEPEGGWDKLMILARHLRFQSQIRPWNDVTAFCAAIQTMSSAKCEIVQKRWSADSAGKKAAKDLCADFVSLLEDEIADTLRCWREHRYPLVMRVLRRAVTDFERQRHATAQLNFSDLLSLAARLLRENMVARDELGARYQHLFVDEFQDTDPLQAEVCFLLSSDSSEGTDWRTVRPRPGSLFVVGDPKQSIYRFRRADIQIYELVRQRMEKLGAVLSLTRNFRSGKAIENLVNAHFSKAFPAAPTDVQAAFSPMLTDKSTVGESVIRRYMISYPGVESSKKAYSIDSAALASWIAGRIEEGENLASDFLILTSRKNAIGWYARALSERNVAVSTTGADLPQELELTELLAVLRAIADPENSVLVAAALEGLFFGMSPADLYTAHETGLHFSITHPPESADLAVGRALAQLHDWWKLSQRSATDVVFERILNDTGLLPYAASQDLGEARAGALLHLVGSLRNASLTGRSGIRDAMEFLNTLLTLDAPDTPLRPGRTDAVRIMNLHKAKGLEAPVVILAAPADEKLFEPSIHIYRTEGASPSGAILLRDGDDNVLAHPVGWAEMSAREEGFQAAERDRLLYVAATRAKKELVVAQCNRQLKTGVALDKSRWRPLSDVLEEFGTLIQLDVTPASGRATVERTGEAFHAEETAAAARVQSATHAGVVFTTVTQSAKHQRDDAKRHDLGFPRGLGAAWGRAVHRSLEGLARGRTGSALAEYLRAVAIDEQLDDDAIPRLERLMEDVRGSDAWRQLESMNLVTPELQVMCVVTADERDVVTEGVIDAAAFDASGWTIVDWKSDDVGVDEWAKRLPQYQSQVSRYAEMLTALSAKPAAARIERVRLES